MSYRPCPLGVHVCGCDDVANEFVTVVNFPAETEAEARYAFAAARSELAEPEKDDFDLVVDLMIGGDIVADFGMRRQMLERLKRGFAYVEMVGEARKPPE